MTNTLNTAQPTVRDTAAATHSATHSPALHRLRNALLKPRLHPSFGRLEAIVLAVYAAILAITIPFHEQWADEAQAWLIARDNSLWDIFYRRLHYEGTPGLWHLILWVAVRLHLPYASINWISGLFAIGGVYILLRFSPFPTLIRLLLPFTFWLQYQYAVTARSYSLMPLFAFCMCALFFLPKPRPVLFALIAGLMANLSLYAFLWAGALALLYLPVLWSRRSTQTRNSLTAAGVLLSTLFLFAFYTALPAPDLVKRQDGATIFQKPSPLRDKLVPPTRSPEGWPPLSKDKLKLDIPAGATDPTRYTRGNALQRALTRVLHPQDPSYSSQTLGHRLQRLIGPFDALAFAASSSNLLAGGFWLVALLWLFARRGLRFALPVLLMCVLGTMTWVNDHHTGLLLLALITALWLASTDPGGRRAHVELSAALSMLFFAVILEQTIWSAHAVAGDIRQPYDPGFATANYLRQNAAGKRIMAYGYETVSIVPFLPPHAFVNQPTTYWIWSANVPYGDRVPLEISKRPDLVVVGTSYIRDQHLANQLVPELPRNGLWMAVGARFLALSGYAQSAQFCGSPFMHAGSSILYCDTIFVPSRPPSASPTR